MKPNPFLLHIPALGGLLAICLLLTGLAAHADDNRGRIMYLRGAVTAMDETGVPRILRADSRVRLGEVIETGPDSVVQIVFPDRSMLHVKPESTLKVEEFNFNRDKPENDGMVVNLRKGGLRSLTGLVGKRNPESVRYETPIATIGIRGTVLEINRAADGSIKTIFDYGKGYIKSGKAETLVEAGEAAEVDGADQTPEKFKFERPEKDPARLAARLARASQADITSVTSTVCKELGSDEVLMMVAIGGSDAAGGSDTVGATVQGLTSCLPVDVAANMLTVTTYINPEAAPELLASAVKGGTNVAIALESVLRGMEHAPEETVKTVVDNAVDLGLRSDDARNILNNLSTEGICR